VGNYFTDQSYNDGFPLVGDSALYIEDLAGYVPANNYFSTATEITSLPFVDETPTDLVFDEATDPMPSCSPYVGHTLWYTYTPAANVQLRMDTFDSDFDTVIGVYYGTPGALTEVGCADETYDLAGNWVSSQSKLDVNLMPGVQYYVGVSGWDGEYGDLMFTVQSVNPPSATPTPAGKKPVLLLPEKKSSTDYPYGLTLAWQPVEGATAYNLQLSDKSNFSNLLVDAELSSPSTLLGMDLPDGKYFWRVSVSQPAVGPWSAKWFFTVDTEGLDALTTLLSPKHMAGVTDNTPTFKWKAVKNAANYRLQISMDYGFSDYGMFFDEWLGSKSTKFTVSDPIYFQGTLFWRVLPADAAGNTGYWSDVSAFTLSALQKPNNEQVYKTKATKPVVLKWAKMSGVAQYQIQVSDNILFQGDMAVNEFTSKTTFKTPALPFGIYYWRVNPDTPYGVEVSDVIWKFVVAPSIPSTPKLLTPANKASVSNPAVVTWKAVAGSVTYDIQIDVDKKFSYPLTISGTAVTYQELPFLFTGNYYWRVRAVNEYGAAGRWSAPRLFTITP